MNEKIDLLIKNATVIFPEGREVISVGVLGEKIVHLGDPHVEAKEVIDGTGLFLLKGGVDGQVHFREPGLTHKEDLASGSLSAALGGITSFLEMPNTNPVTSTVEKLKEKVELASQKSWVDFGFYMGATGDNLSELLMAGATEGCVGIKIFFGSSTGPLLLNDQEKILKIFKEVKVPIALHCEDEKILQSRSSIKENAKSVHAHPDWRNVASALSATEQVLQLAQMAKRKVHILHVTTREEMELLARNKAYCTVEVTPQHLTLFAPDCYDRWGTLAQMNPPIRAREHQEALWRALVSEIVDVLGSDHAPHTLEEKGRGYPNTPSGIPGVQTMFPLMLHYALTSKISLEHCTRLMSFNTAKIFGLEDKGSIALGADADLIIVNARAKDIIRGYEQRSKSGYTVYDGMELQGRIERVFLRGKTLILNKQICGDPRGRVLKIKKELT